MYKTDDRFHLLLSPIQTLQFKPTQRHPKLTKANQDDHRTGFARSEKCFHSHLQVCSHNGQVRKDWASILNTTTRIYTEWFCNVR